MSAGRLVVSVSPARADLVSGELWALGTLGIEERHRHGEVQLLAGFASVEEAHAARLTVGGAVEAISEDAGLDEWRAWAQPVSAGTFWLAPTWIEADTPPAKTRIDIDPGRSFGSGSHVTTVLALEAISSLTIGGCSALDMGTGSGVLAIAAAKAGASSVLAIDCDAHAVEVAALNSVRNGTDAAVETAVGSRPPDSGRFDLVLANLLLADLEPIASALASRLATNGSLVTTGHLTSQRPRVVAALGLEVVEAREHDEWSLLVMASGS